ncbi:MAG: carboxypeptidase-like regulatory domain-containing protein [Planctomycetota bacterium]|nr:carboxypeptidase-like regulatory domain-containing protein [Planctomycetota bacterium]
MPDREPMVGRGTDVGGKVAASEHATADVPADGVVGVEGSAILRDSAHCLVHVVNGARAPLEGCEVLAWRDGVQEVLKQTTDAHGAASFPTGGAGGVAAVAPNGTWAVMHPIQWAGEHTLVLGGDAVVGGAILVDGEPAPAGLEVTLLTRGVPLPGSAPPAVVERLREWATLRHTKTGTGGLFAFTGLSSGWRGSLMPPPTHWLTQRDGAVWDPQALGLAAPDAGLVVSMTRLPQVSGRVVWDDDGAPVPAANVAASADFGNDITAARGVSTAPDGSFALGLTPSYGNLQALWADARRRPQVQRLRLFCAGVPGSAGRVEVDVEGQEAAARPIEIRIRRAPRTHFLVTDDGGEPIAGARVDVKESLATDRDGRGHFQGPAASLVGAPGYAVVPARAVGGDGSAGNPLCFVLQRANKLRIVVDAASTEAARSHEITIESSVPIMAGRRGWRGFDAEFGGSQCGSGSKRRTLPSGEVEQRQILHVTPDVDGGAVVHSLEPGVECVLFVRDQMGSVLAQTSFTTPQSGGESSVAVTIEQIPRRIRGKVLRPDGTPFTQAEVKLVAGELRTTTYTLEDGVFRFPAVYTDAPIDLVVHARGYMKAVRSRIFRASDEEVHEIRLVAGRTVTVRVIDAAGEPIDLFAKPVGFEDQEAQRVGVGVFQWADLPQFVQFYAEVAEHRYATPPDTESAEVRLQVPVLARALAPVSSFPAGRGWERNDCLVELRPVEHPEQAPVRLRFQDAEDAAVFVLPGRYAATLVKWHLRESGGLEYVPLGVTSTIDLPGSKLTRITFD